MSRRLTPTRYPTIPLAAPRDERSRYIRPDVVIRGHHLARIALLAQTGRDPRQAARDIAARRPEYTSFNYRQTPVGYWQDVNNAQTAVIWLLRKVGLADATPDQARGKITYQMFAAHSLEPMLRQTFGPGHEPGQLVQLALNLVYPVQERREPE